MTEKKSLMLIEQIEKFSFTRLASSKSKMLCYGLDLGMRLY